MVFFYCDHCCQECKNIRDFNKHIESKNHIDILKIYNETIELERLAELECQEEHEQALNNFNTHELATKQHNQHNSKPEVVAMELNHEKPKSDVIKKPESNINPEIKPILSQNNTIALNDNKHSNASITPPPPISSSGSDSGSGSGIGEYICDYCSQEYKYKKSYDTHIEKCYKQTVRILQTKITETTAKKLIKLLSKNTQSDGLCNLTNANKITNNSVGTNSGIVADTVNTQNIQNNYINVYPFGNEDLSMLTDEVKINIYKRGFTAYENLLNEIYKHDQNKNIFISNQRDGIVKFINENKELEIGYIKDAIEKIYDTKKDILLQIIDEYRGTQNKHAEKRIDDLEKAMNDNTVDKKYYTMAKLKLHQISAFSKKKLKEIDS